MRRKDLVIKEGVLVNKDFWWLIGFLQGDGSVDRRNGIWVISTDREALNDAERIVKNLFGLGSSFYLEQRGFPEKHRPMLKLAVFSRRLVIWFESIGLKFGEKKWNVPRLRLDLFYSYLAGLFDVEGRVMLRRNRSGHSKASIIIIHSANLGSLRLWASRLILRDVRFTLLKRVRRNKPNPHYELRLCRRYGLVWFKENVIGNSHLSRK